MDEIDDLFDELDTVPKVKKRKRKSKISSSEALASSVRIDAASESESVSVVPATQPVDKPGDSNSLIDTIDITRAHNLLAAAQVVEPAFAADFSPIGSSGPQPLEPQVLSTEVGDIPIVVPSSTPPSALFYGSRLLHGMFERVPTAVLESRFARPLTLDVVRGRPGSGGGFTAAKHAALRSAYLNSADVRTPGRPGCNAPLGQRTARALAALRARGTNGVATATATGACAPAATAAPAAAAGLNTDNRLLGVSSPRHASFDLQPAFVEALHAQWNAYAFRLLAALATAADVSPDAAAETAPDSAHGTVAGTGQLGHGSPRKTAQSEVNSQQQKQQQKMKQQLSKGAVLGRLSLPGSGGGGGMQSAAGGEGEGGVGIKRMRAVLSAAVAYAAAARSPPKQADALNPAAPLPPPPASAAASAAALAASAAPSPGLAGAASAALYARRGFSASTAHTLLSAAAADGTLAAVEWRYAALCGAFIQGGGGGGGAMLSGRLTLRSPSLPSSVLDCPRDQRTRGATGYVVGLSSCHVHLATQQQHEQRNTGDHIFPTFTGADSADTSCRTADSVPSAQGSRELHATPSWRVHGVL
jgi:hypothetical protein